MSRQVKCLGDIAEFIRGITFKPDETVSSDIEGAVVCMRTKNIQKYLDESDLIAVPAPLVRRQELYLKAGDILISSANSLNLVGKVVQVPELKYKATAGGFIAIVRANKDMVDPDYLYHWLASERSQAAIRACGRQTTNISNLSVPQFLNLEINLPIISEQKRTAELLRCVELIRRKRIEAIQLTEGILSAAYADMFGDAFRNEKNIIVRELGEVCRFYAGNTLPLGEPYKGQTDGVLHIKVGEMNLPGNENEIQVAREWSSTGLGGVIAPEGAILIPKRGGAIATNKKRVLKRACVLDPNLMAISSGELLRKEVLLQWFKDFDLTSITSGSAVPQLNKGDLQPLKIIVPPLSMQDRFVSIAKHVDHILENQKLQQKTLDAATASITSNLLYV